MKNNQCPCTEKELHPCDQLSFVKAKIGILQKIKINSADCIDCDFENDLELFCSELKEQIEQIQEQIEC